MPTCVDCDHYWRPGDLGEGGACPSCGQALDTTPPEAPWHFKLLLIATVIYLGWRAVQGIAWVLQKI